jgi:hypothetical protein
MKPFLSRTEKYTFTRLVWTFNVATGESPASGWPAASLAGGGPPGDGASWANADEATTS